MTTTNSSRLTEPARNEAAERLRDWILFEHGAAGTPYSRNQVQRLDEALAAERRATVERIRERIDRLDYRGPRVFDWDSLAAILDEEAA